MFKAMSAVSNSVANTCDVVDDGITTIAIGVAMTKDSMQVARFQHMVESRGELQSVITAGKQQGLTEEDISKMQALCGL